MGYLEALRAFSPSCEQEERDQSVILNACLQLGDGVLARNSAAMHLTSSGLIVNETRDKVLFIHHNIYRVWSWTGGHADGDGDLLRVALREAREETGLCRVRPLMEEMLSLDILPVWGHVHRGVYVSAHLHLNAAYLLTASEADALHCKADENSGVKWFPFSEIERAVKEPVLPDIYMKMLRRAGLM